MDYHPVIVIGGGPAGLFCAAEAAGSGEGVLLLEKMLSCGRKLLVTGSGQCNLTHDGEIRDFSGKYGDHGAFLRSSLRKFSNRDLVAWFTSRGLPLAPDESGKIFPESRRAADVLSVLLEECRKNGVVIRCREAVKEIRRSGTTFHVRTGTAEYESGALVIATGGSSYPATGSTGDGFSFAASLGHHIAPVGPALAPIRVRDYPFGDLAGISFEGLSLSLFREGKKVREGSGDLMFTHAGLSGPGILHLSRYVLPGDTLKISFLPGMRQELLTKDLVDRIAVFGTQQVKSILSGYSLPARFIARVLELLGLPGDLTDAHLPKKKRAELVRMLTAFPFVVSGTGDWDEAMVTRGGISLAEIDPLTMESLIVPRLYCIGEVLDIDGDTGGYNLQAAFSTAMAAAQDLSAR
ncbi:MAG: NAD(P)/FAD-dependent oxidoreductase [Methanomicrobiales archaeon]|nr:NAD(P)/FAD-dependent oxidoreductase [Methanomicrobiales archaeon]